jgi:hypothetical protein
MIIDIISEDRLVPGGKKQQAGARQDTAGSSSSLCHEDVNEQKG